MKIIKRNFENFVFNVNNLKKIGPKMNQIFFFLNLILCEMYPKKCLATVNLAHNCTNSIPWNKKKVVQTLWKGNKQRRLWRCDNIARMVVTTCLEVYKNTLWTLSYYVFTTYLVTSSQRWIASWVITRRNFGWFRTFIIPRPYYDSSHWNYFRKFSMKEVLK